MLPTSGAPAPAQSRFLGSVDTRTLLLAAVALLLATLFVQYSHSSAAANEQALVVQLAVLSARAPSVTVDGVPDAASANAAEQAFSAAVAVAISGQQVPHAPAGLAPSPSRPPTEKSGGAAGTATQGASSSSSPTPSQTPSASHTPSPSPTPSAVPPGPVIAALARDADSSEEAAWWRSLFMTEAPPATVPLLPCHEYVEREGLSSRVAGYILSQYFPGDCRAVDPPSAFDFCYDGTPAVEPAMDCSPDWWDHCEAKRRAANSDVPVRLCTHEGMPELLRYQTIFVQRYQYADRALAAAALEELGAECMNTRVAVYSMGFFHGGGPRKVAHNLVSGLRLIGQPFALNPRRLAPYEVAWSIDPHASSLAYSDQASHLQRVLFGPTLVGHPYPDGMLQFNLIKPWTREVVHMVGSSAWQATRHRTQGWNQYFHHTRVWPTGVDDRLFSGPTGDGSRAHIPRPLPRSAAVSYLVYSKQRGECHNGPALEAAVGSLPFRREPLDYGSYTEEEFRQTLNRVAFAVVVADSETQGFAIEEMMASNVPLLVAKCVHDFGSTSTPYWSEGETGMIVDPGKGDVAGQVDEFLRGIDEGRYNPRAFIMRELSLAGGAIDFMRIVCGKQSRFTPPEWYGQ